MIERSGLDRRSGQRILHLPERRTGYQRRDPSPVLSHLSNNHRLFASLMVGIVIMSAGDWLLTLIALRMGAVEGNPVLDSLLSMNPIAAAGFKAVLTLLVVSLMWTQRKYRSIAAVSLAAFLLYFALISYHLGGLAGAGLI
jgi:hypothetical protein